MTEDPAKLAEEMKMESEASRRYHADEEPMDGWYSYQCNPTKVTWVGWMGFSAFFVALIVWAMS